MRFAKLMLVMAVIAALVFATGCAARKTVQKTPQPEDDGSGMVEDYTPPQKSSGGMKYVVKRGDTLWGISSMGRIYQDPFRWPLVYKINRDQIEDPDLIYPDQELSIKTDWSRDEVSDAVEKAKDTPPYRPHTAPRKKLPLRY